MTFVSESWAKRKHNVDRVPKQQWVFGGLSRETKESYLLVEEDRSAASLMPIII